MLCKESDTALIGLLPEASLHHSVFKRMEADDREPSPWRKKVDGMAEKPFQRAKFIVDRDPKRLKHFCCGMDAAASAVCDLSEHRQEVTDSHDGMLSTSVGDCSRVGPGARIFSVLPDNPFKLSL
jgi:hypothetical protein